MSQNKISQSVNTVAPGNTTYADYLKEALQDPNSYESIQLDREIEVEMWLLMKRRQANQG